MHPFIKVINDAEIPSVLLGTDGAFGDLSVEKIQDIIHRTKEPSQVLTSMMELARNQGEMDNQTAIYILSEGKREDKENGDMVSYYFPEENRVTVEESPEKTREIIR